MHDHFVANEEVPKTVSYRILIPFGGQFYKAGQITIKNLEGDIFYTPSQAIRIKDGQVYGTVDHVSFHKSNRSDNISIKFVDGSREILGTRLPIQNTGYQVMFEDYIFDLPSLPVHTKKVDRVDLVFDLISDTVIKLQLSIISGCLIIKPGSIEGVTVTQQSKHNDRDLLDVKHRCLGWHSGNADKLMQYSLSRCTKPDSKDPRIKRTIYIPPSQGIRRPILR